MSETTGGAADAAPKKEKKAAAKKNGAAKAKKPAGEGGAKKGGKPSGMYGGKVIQKLADKNPRREGTHGFRSFALMRNGMTYEKFVAAGGRRQDLDWDVKHGNVKMVKA